MFTTGSKFLIGAAVISLVATLVYGIGQGGVMGTIGLTSATVARAGLAALNLFLRDSNVFADDAQLDTSSAAQHAPGASVWPLAFAVGAIVVTVGLVTFQPIVIIGLVLVLAAGAEWAVQAWSERASGTVAHNASVRSKLSNPLEYPIGSAIAIGIVVYGFSRVMLWLSKTNTVIAFGVLASIVLAIAFVFAARRNVGKGVIGGALGAGAVAIIVAGFVTGIDGERDIPVFETTALWQSEAILHPEEFAEGTEKGKHPAGLICESPEEFPEADEDASQTVGNKSNTVNVTLGADDTLTYRVPGPTASVGIEVPTFARSNATNVIFFNRSDEHRRLSVSLGTEEVEVDGETVTAPNQLCTTLIEPGAEQLITVIARQPSFAFDDGFFFFVPGVDDARLELVVP